MRRISCASAETALRPRCVSAPAWAGRPCSVSVRQIAPLRSETRSPFSRAHSNTSAAAAPRASVAHGRRAQARLLVGAHQQAHLRERPARRARRAARSRPPPAAGRPSCRRRRARSSDRRPAGTAAAAAVPTGTRCRCGRAARPSARRRPAASRPCCARGRRARPPTGSCSRPAPATRRPARRSTPARSRPRASRGSTSCFEPGAEALDDLRSRSAPPSTGRRRCGSRSPPRTPAGRRPRTRARAATWRSSRSSGSAP